MKPANDRSWHRSICGLRSSNFQSGFSRRKFTGWIVALFVLCWLVVKPSNVGAVEDASQVAQISQAKIFIEP